MSPVVKLNIGSGFTRYKGFTNVDRIPYKDDKGTQFTDIICDIEKDALPYPDNSVDVIICYEVLDHLHNLIFAMNEMWRVLKPEGILKGKLPKENGRGALADPTHKRIILKATFDYFTGVNRYKKSNPSRPKNADYGVKPWYKILVDTKINFILRPRKTEEYNKQHEKI